MTTYSIWPSILSLAVLVIFASSPWFASVTPANGGSAARLEPLDGLRGFCALGVFFLHAAIYHDYIISGRWAWPPVSYFALLGTGGVATFFMITGFLFWSKLLADRGRPNWLKLFSGRVFRIAPLYLFAVSIVIFLVMQDSAWQLRVNLQDFLTELACWSALGVCDPVDINEHVATFLLMVGVMWSLRYEWIFYASLPLLAQATRTRRRAFIFMVLSLFAAFSWTIWGSFYVFVSADSVYVTLFVLGMATATIRHCQWRIPLGNLAASALASALLGAFFLFCSSAYTPTALLLLGGTFLLIASGCTMFGVLTLPGAVRLGEMSYGIYLLQGLVLTIVFRVEILRSLAITSPARYWTVILASALLLVVCSALTSILIEKPCVAAGRRILRSRKQVAAQAFSAGTS